MLGSLREKGFSFTDDENEADAAIVAVAHDEFRALAPADLAPLDPGTLRVHVAVPDPS